MPYRAGETRRDRAAAVGADGPAGQLLYVVDDAVLDTLIRAVLGPPGSRGVGYVQVISIIEIAIQPRLIVVKIVTMTAGAFLNAHGLGLLAPASGRILTWTLVRMLDTLLGPDRRSSRLQWLLGWLEISLYARDGRLGSSPGFRSKLADWLNRLWKGTPRRRPHPQPRPPKDERPPPAAASPLHRSPPLTLRRPHPAASAAASTASTPTSTVSASAASIPATEDGRGARQRFRAGVAVPGG